MVMDGQGLCHLLVSNMLKRGVNPLPGFSLVNFMRNIPWRFVAIPFLLSGFAMSTSLTAADNRDRYEARTFMDGEGKKLNYRLLRPKGYDPKKAYPLVRVR